MKEFRLEDDRFSVKEKGFEGEVKKEAGTTDKDTSFVMAERISRQMTSFSTYLVINPDHRERNYPAESYAQFQYKDLEFGRIKGTRIDENGKEVSFEVSVSESDPEKYPTVYLHELIKNKTIESTDTIILELYATPKAPDPTDPNSKPPEEIDMKTVVYDGRNKDEANYKMKPAKLEISSKKQGEPYLARLLGHPPFTEVKPKDYETNKEAKTKYDKALAEYKALLEKYYNEYRKEFYVKYESEDTPVEVLNYKGVYPFTGGFGPNRWIVIIGAVIAAVAAEEYIRRKRSSAPKGVRNGYAVPSV